MALKIKTRQMPDGTLGVQVEEFDEHSVEDRRAVLKLHSAMQAKYGVGLLTPAQVELLNELSAK